MNFPYSAPFQQIGSQPMNEQWHIPRASLGGSSASDSSQRSIDVGGGGGSGGGGGIGSGYVTVYHHQHQPSRKSRHTTSSHHKTNSDGSGGGGSGQDRRSSSAGHRDIQTRFDRYPGGPRRTSATLTAATAQRTDTEPKRGSRSSQGSTDSNHSSHSASSGSLLLTAANLEHFTKIHRNATTSGSTGLIGIGGQTTLDPRGRIEGGGGGGNINGFGSRHLYHTNITLPPLRPSTGSVTGTKGDESLICNDDAIMIHVDPDRRTKDVDTMSLASSTHFTVVNGMGGPQRVAKSGLCSRGHQITVLILCMSMVFLIGIAGGVFLLELRARDMPH